MIIALGRAEPRESKTTARYRLTGVENEGRASSAAPPAVQCRNRPGSILVLRFRSRVIVAEEASIERIDGAGNYVRVHVGMEKHRVRGTLKDLQKVLPPQFVRSHRSTIINLAAVHELVRTPFGDLIAVLRSGARQTVGRTFRRSVEAALAASR
jgi:DNA-binding LytR/AlgR family response regulator